VAGNSASRVRVTHGSWFDALPDDRRGELALIVSNPPYIADGERADLPSVVVDHEPGAALFAGPTGLECVEVIVGGAATWLRPGGAVVVEIAPHQGDAAVALATRARLTGARVEADLAGRNRVLVARRR
jgi:release factor glutamine methyltransferase